MADQVSPTANPISGLAAAVPAAVAPKAVPAIPVAGQTVPASAEAQVLAHPKAQALALSQINASLEQAASELKIQVDKGSGRTVYSIVEPNSGHVVLQIPSEEVLAMARNLKALDPSISGSPGVLLDKEG